MEYLGETHNGYGIWRKEEPHGGFSYWTDDIGGGRVVWDDGLCNLDILVDVMSHKGINLYYE